MPIPTAAIQKSQSRPRTSGELTAESAFTTAFAEPKLGIEAISRSTVKAILKEHGIAPALDRPRGSWSEFIRIHAAPLVQCDFLFSKAPQPV